MFQKKILWIMLGIVGILIFSCVQQSNENEQKVIPTNSESSLMLDAEINESDISPQLKCHGKNSKIRNIALFYLFFKREKAKPLKHLFTKDAKWTNNGLWEDVTPFAGTYNGRSEIINFFDEYFDELNITCLKIEYYFIDENRISVHFNMQAEILSTDKTIDMEFGDIWEVNDKNQIISCHRFYDTYAFTQAFTNDGPQNIIDTKTQPDNHYVMDASYNTKEIVEGVYHDFWSSNLEGIFAALSEDVEIHFKGPQDQIPFVGEYYGHDDFMNFLINVGSTSSVIDGQIISFTSNGNKCDAIVYEEWYIFSTGKIYTILTLNTWTLDENGKVIEIDMYPDTYEIAESYWPD